MTIIFQATWTVRPGRLDEAVAALQELTAASRLEPGNIAYEPFADPGVPDDLRIFEAYVDDDALDAHQSADHFRAFAQRADDLLVSRRRDYFVSIDAPRR